MLQAEGLTCRFGERTLWEGLALELRAGERLALVAPSGAGKTLLLRALALLDPLQGGRLLLHGRSPEQWTLPRYRSRVMLVAQRPAMAAGTVEQNLSLVHGFRSHRRRPFQRQRLLDWLATLGREPGFLGLDAERLSGGERQLVALLRALQLDPDILLLDEPTASLDAATTAAVEALLRSWLEGGERASLLTSHDGGQIHRFTSRVLELAP